MLTDVNSLINVSVNNGVLCGSQEVISRSKEFYLKVTP